ncbi:carboxymuconolactone decarboxylase family protein [Georgenia sp. SYP-B2076]|uniref:carboxymuconolactone decarboxylase family protein n=1 Tax=Georgenia sp. SYP-B2076 TaxID=2495881 RepID=UPI000F8D9E1B|nr:carboxymuconolactone decarboxylase family protein [Georgenia sp. SYP-B2076]
MSFISTIGEDEAQGRTADVYDRERARVGYLPRYAMTFGARPDVYTAWRGLIGAITAGMDPRRFELVTLAAARELRSTYCALAHGSLLAERFVDQDTVVSLMADPSDAGLAPDELAVLAFAAKVARGAADVEADDVQALRDVGLSDPEVLDVALAVAARCFFSTVLDATGTAADPVYGRTLDPVLREALTVGRPATERP